jgi:Carboxypeptidase regulatory-like domain/TonB-dependent Receptor Plug Domain
MPEQSRLLSEREVLSARIVVRASNKEECSMRFRRLFVTLAIVCLATPLAFAQTHGSMSGVVTDPDGAGLPGVTVTITGAPMPLPRTFTTLSDGSFQFSGLIPGDYRLRAELSGLGSYETPVIVQLQRDTQVRPVLRATATAEVEVSAAAPIVDTKATDISEVTTKEQIEKLPLARTFTGTFQLAPGVAQTGIEIGPANVGVNAGGGRQDNTYLYDGVNVTNPFFGDAYQDFAELDIQEVNITRGGISAEFGRTGGFLVNGITRSGTNDFHGEARIEWTPTDLSADSKDATLEKHVERVRPGVAIGGRIIPDHLFFYASANFYRQSEQDRINNTGPLPDSDFDQDELFGKLTLNPVSSVLFEGSYRWRDSTVTNDGITSRESATVASDGDIRDRVVVISGLWTATPQLSFEAKYNHNENKNTGTPAIQFGYLPPFNAADPSQVGRFDNGLLVSGSDDFIQTQDYFRDEYRFSGAYLANFFGGTHDIRAGVSFSKNEEDLDRIANGWGSIILNDSGSCLTAPRPCYRARYWSDQPAQISEAETWGIFLQDRITWDRLTLNIGVLANQDEFIPNGGQVGFDILRGDFTIPNASIPTCASAPGATTCTYQDTKTFDFEDQIQPRIGVAYVFDKAVGDKIYANFGRYSNMDNQSFSRSAAPLRPFRVDAFIHPQTGEVMQSVVRNNQTGKRVLENIDPTKTDEYIAGYARPLPGGWSAELWGMYRRTDDIIEDFPGVNRQTGSGFRYGNIPGYRRYKAGTVEVRKALRDNWSLDVSYTLSRLEGNWDLDYATQLFYTSSYIEDGPGLYVTDPNRDGILTGDRTHVAKLFATYVFPTNTNVGAYLRHQSGRPYEARGFDVLYGTDYLYLEDAGSRRTSSWTNLDLSFGQSFRLGPGELNVGVSLLNVFNSQPALAVQHDVCLIGPCTAIPPEGDANRNPNFERATIIAPPRRASVSVTYSF